jgi:hypothetical protein
VDKETPKIASTHFLVSYHIISESGMFILKILLGVKTPSIGLAAP